MRDMTWPIGLFLAMLVVVVVNLAVAWYAVNNPPSIMPSYDTETR